MSNLRLPIASRLFIGVLMTSLIILLVGLFMLHYTMQKGFSRYVAEVEMQRLDLLVDTLANQYRRHGSWQNTLDAANEAQSFPIDRLQKGWLRFEYEQVLRYNLKRRLEEHYARNDISNMYFESGS